MGKIKVNRVWNDVGANKPLTSLELSKLVGVKVYYGTRNDKRSVAGNYVEIVLVDEAIITAKGTTGSYSFHLGTLFKDELAFLNWCISGNVNTEYEYS